jgi:hypothetical protein
MELTVASLPSGLPHRNTVISDSPPVFRGR